MKQKKRINTFWDCNVTKGFWFSIMDFLKNIDGSNVNLTPKGIILGNVQFESNLPFLDCIIIFKYYLYILKLKDMIPNLNAWLQFLNS